MKAYKGFNEDMTCRGFQYEEGKEYEEPEAVVCDKGFHSCEYPLDCLGYYSPNKSVYREVEVGGDVSRKDSDSDTKIATTKIKIGVRLSIAGLVKAAIDYTMERTVKENSADEGRGAASATGEAGAASATGEAGAASATGYAGAASATGEAGAASAMNETAIAVAWGVSSKARGVIGAHLVLSEWNFDYETKRYQLMEAKMVQVDGEKIKPETWYKLENGEVVEWEDE